MIAIHNNEALYAGDLTLTDEGLRGHKFIDRRLNPGNTVLLDLPTPQPWRGGGYTWDGTAFTRTAWFEAEIQADETARKIAQAKAEQQEADAEPLTVNLGGVDYSFVMDSDAKESIEGGISEFQTVRTEFVAAGYAGPANAIPWVTVDDQTVDITVADLQTIRQAYARRKTQNHIAYQAAKASA